MFQGFLNSTDRVFLRRLKVRADFSEEIEVLFWIPLSDQNSGAFSLLYELDDLFEPIRAVVLKRLQFARNSVFRLARICFLETYSGSVICSSRPMSSNKSTCLSHL
jgi:hypothetical protein